MFEQMQKFDDAYVRGAVVSSLGGDGRHAVATEFLQTPNAAEP